MELTRIIISENNEQQIIFLKEVDGERTFPIVIGIFEATSIDRRVKGLPAPRPLTHDLLASTIELLGGELQDIFISELRDHTYFAKLRIRHEGELIEVDSRPATPSPSPSPLTCRSTSPRTSSTRSASNPDWPDPINRRGARVVDWDGLENRSARKPTGVRIPPPPLRLDPTGTV